jgi:hypothetical protein
LHFCFSHQFHPVERKVSCACPPVSQCFCSRGTNLMRWMSAAPKSLTEAEQASWGTSSGRKRITPVLQI